MLGGHGLRTYIANCNHSVTPAEVHKHIGTPIRTQGRNRHRLSVAVQEVFRSGEQGDSRDVGISSQVGTWSRSARTLSCAPDVLSCWATVAVVKYSTIDRTAYFYAVCPNAGRE